jgi:hypothetical protein
MIYSTYDLATGQITSTVSDASTVVPDNAVLGAYNDLEHYVDVANKTVINKPEMPGNDYHWNFDSNTWTLDSAAATRSARQYRNTLLSVVDRVNPVWYNSLTDSQKQEIADYRTALLNVPQQSGFPAAIEWPTRPTWL